MKERPILFSAPMVRALLDGSKTQTRRVVKPQPEWTEPATIWQQGDGHSGPGWYAHNEDYPDEGALFYRPLYGQPGDRLWVRESHAFTDLGDGTPVVAYRADESQIAIGRNLPNDDDFLISSFCFSESVYVDRWRPSIHMPRWASRITLAVTGVRVERLQDINEADARAEGLTCKNGLYGTPWQVWQIDPRKAYRDLWESINGPDSWATNPWVWAIEFKRIKQEAA